MGRRTATVFTEALPSSGARIGAQVVVIDGPDQGRYAPLSDRPLVVGSDPGCDLDLSDDSVSARHVEIAADAGHFAVRDLGSKNGTVYEGSLIAAATVTIGATLRLGQSYVRIQPVLEELEVEPSQARRFGELVGESLIIREVFAVLELAAASDVTILLEGETGTGKELAARALHENGARRQRPFVAVDCGALPESLIESELFGHVRGAFTGASAPRKGAFARADGGTLFLDELDGVPPAVQARLLRVIEERRVKPLGSDAERSIDVRLVAASRRDLEALVAAGEFRPDLFYRLSVIRVHLPPLRQRKEDIAPIAAELLRRRGVDAGAVDGRNLDRLLAHDWPGNARELRNVIERALALAPGASCFGDLRVGLSPVAGDPDIAGVRTDLPFSEAKELVIRSFERHYLRDLLTREGGNISATARAAGIDRKHLRSLLIKHGLI
jgi:DNA-binding NtrC family response regulator